MHRARWTDFESVREDVTRKSALPRALPSGRSGAYVDQFLVGGHVDDFELLGMESRFRPE
jgi:hypothetical protein